MQPIERESRGHVSFIWLNRPEKRNAINRAMLDGLDKALSDLADDQQTRVIVLAGRGPSFCAGFDVSKKPGEGEHGSAEPIADFADLDHRMTRFLQLWDHPKPIIAAVHGHCLAAATMLCVLSDITLVTPDAKIGFSMLPLGGGYLEPTWVHLVGPKRAKQLALMPGSTITGEMAVQWGWANYAVPQDRLHDEAFAVGTQMARMPSDLLRLRKRAVNRMVELAGFKNGLRMGAESDALLHQSNAVKRMRQLIADLGMSEAVRRFQAGTLDT